MLGSHRARRAFTAAVAVAAFASVGATTANAKVVTVTDDVAADFAAGTQSSTVVRAPGSVELARTLEEQFDAALPGTWTSTPWAPGGAASVVAGALLVDGTHLDTGVSAGPGSSLEFTAKFGTDDGNQHVGFATDFNVEPWAIFSTGSSGGSVVARVFDGAVMSSYPVAGLDLTVPHNYRIDWAATGDFAFSVDGTPVPTLPTPPPPVTAQMRVQASDLAPGGQAISIDSIALNTHKTPGTFTSRALDAGDARVTALSLNATSTGTAIAYETRSADTAAGLDAAAWAPLGAGGAVASPPKRFLQYRAMLSTTVATATPTLDKVEAAFTVDDQAPTVTIQGVAVSGDTAKVTFSSDDAAATVKCKLDGAAFATCASPAEFGGLAPGTHTIVVQATDAHGNVGDATRTFEIASPPPAGSGSTTTPPPPTPPANVSAPDRTAPKVLVMGTSLRVSESGVAKLRIRCPRSEASCAVTVKLKRGGKRIASKSLTLSGGGTRTFSLRLSKATRKALAARSRLTATAVITAEDAAGNETTTKRRVTLRD
jgi:hypothetical protein